MAEVYLARVTFRAIMEKDSCNVIYVDRAVSRDRHVGDLSRAHEGKDLEPWESEVIENNVGLVLGSFGKGNFSLLLEHASLC